MDEESGFKDEFLRLMAKYADEPQDFTTVDGVLFAYANKALSDYNAAMATQLMGHTQKPSNYYYINNVGEN